MGSSVDIRIKTNKESVRQLLAQCPSLKQQVITAIDYLGHIRLHGFEVYSLAIQKYVDTKAGIFDRSKPEDKIFLQKFEKGIVFTPDFFELSKDMLGGDKWNLNFFRFVKHSAVEARALIEIDYLREWNDWPYQKAAWVFDYRPNNQEVVEHLSVELCAGDPADFDDSDDIHDKQAQIELFRDGTITRKDFELP